jgi:hypothetical protein
VYQPRRKEKRIPPKEKVTVCRVRNKDSGKNYSTINQQKNQIIR